MSVSRARHSRAHAYIMTTEHCPHGSLASSAAVGGEHTGQPMHPVWAAVTRLPAQLLIALVRLYQITLSPLVGRSCRYQPSCSNYMIEAVRKYGFLRGCWRGVCRIARCHPFHAGGYDPP